MTLWSFHILNLMYVVFNQIIDCVSDICDKFILRSFQLYTKLMNIIVVNWHGMWNYSCWTSCISKCTAMTSTKNFILNLWWETTQYQATMWRALLTSLDWLVFPVGVKIIAIITASSNIISKQRDLVHSFVRSNTIYWKSYVEFFLNCSIGLQRESIHDVVWIIR